MIPNASSDRLCVGFAALDRLMPMHVLVGPDERIVRTGPAWAKICPGLGAAGRPFFEMFEPRRALCKVGGMGRCSGNGGKLHLRLRDRFQTQLTGIAVPLPDRGGMLVNLSFGISVIDAVGRYDLAGSDFAATDLTLEMLYLVEAKSAALEESGRLNQRLDGARQAAEADAASDTLTGLANRRVLAQALQRLITRGVPFTLMHLDLDHFKAVNDRLGHAAGDYVLTEVARILGAVTRGGDVVARVGGDEFVLIFEGVTDRVKIETLAARLIRQLEAPLHYEGETVRISGSIGVVFSTDYDLPDCERMLLDADSALYVSKNRGRGRFSFFREDGKARKSDGLGPTPPI